MKDILCPVDFSMSSERVARYAAQLARDTESQLVLVAVRAPELVSAGGRGEVDEGDVFDRLGELHDLLKVDYNIPCTINENVLLGNVSKKLSLLTDHYDITVLASPQENSSDFENSSGFDLVKTIRNSVAPLLVVPENFKYEKISTLTYAYDYLHEPEAPLIQLHWLANWYGASIRFVSIVRDSSNEEEYQLDVLEGNISANWKYDVKIGFESIPYNDTAKCLDHYISLWSENNLLVLSVNHKNILERLWHKSVVKQLLRDCKHPYLVLHK